MPRSVQAVKVLAVDDNAANLKLIAAMLKEMVTEVVVCKNGKEAVNLAQSQPFDIIFMDIQMPVMDGISATQAIRHHSSTPRPPSSRSPPMPFPVSGSASFARAWTTTWPNPSTRGCWRSSSPTSPTGGTRITGISR
jgi:CheY-like chemotaxis protein